MEQNTDTEVLTTTNGCNNHKWRKVLMAIAVCSIAFNIYGAIQISEKDDHILALEKQIVEQTKITQSVLATETDTASTQVPDTTFTSVDESTDGTALAAEKSKNKAAPTTQEESTSDKSQCPSLVANYNHDNHEIAMVVASAKPHAFYRVYYLFDDGKLIAANELTRYSPCSREMDLTAKFSGKIVDLAVGEVGDGGISTLIALLEDGRIETIEEALEGRDYPEKNSAVSGADKIVKIYGLYSGTEGVLGRAINEKGEKRAIVIEDASSIPQKFALQ